MGGLHAILTGDLVGSTKLELDDLDAVREALLHAVKDIAGWRAGLVVGEAEFYRGDSWQLLLRDPGMFLRAALYLRAALRRQKDWDTRISIGIGKVDRIDPKQISLSMGEGFVLSGRGLDAMGSAPGFSFNASPALQSETAWVQPILDLCDVLVSRLKPGQSATICEALDPSNPTQKDIAARLGISQQGVSNALSSAGWSAISTALDLVERVPLDDA